MTRKVATFKGLFEVKLSKQRMIIMTYSEDIDTIKTLIESLYDELMKEMDEVRGDKDFYDGNKDETISEYTQMKMKQYPLILLKRLRHLLQQYMML